MFSTAQQKTLNYSAGMYTKTFSTFTSFDSWSVKCNLQNCKSDAVGCN